MTSEPPGPTIHPLLLAFAVIYLEQVRLSGERMVKCKSNKH